MSYDFVQATADYGPRKGPVEAFVVHMAEGGGTVGYLSNPSVPRGVSVHYVVEYSGRIVQMLRESHASGSINPKDVRTTTDPDGFYGATAAKAVMGDWWKDPNSAVISCEVEGFAKDGPNAAQAAALASLVKDVRSRYPGMGLLGHRDFADYKACPGKHIDWPRLGGHGLFAQEDPVGQSFTFDASLRLGRLTVTETGHAYQRLHDQTLAPIVPGPDWTDRKAFGPVKLTIPIPGGAGTDRTTAYIVTGASGAAAVLAFAGTFTQDGADCSDAVAAEHERTRAAAIAAVEAIA